jgi:enediyne biosynthesis protein E4
MGWGTTFRQRPLVFHNLKGEKFEVIPPVRGTGLAMLMKARGAAFGDLFNDGKMDVVINQVDDVPILLRNVNPDKNHWVALKLIGGPKSPRDAVGTAVYITAGGLRQRADILSGGSFASSNDQRVHFGLGESTVVRDVEIHWPSGAVEHISLPAVNRFYAIEEGRGVVPSVYDRLASHPRNRRSSSSK